MENKTNMFVKIAANIIGLLWFYAAFSKLLGFETFAIAMHRQEVWPFFQTLLIYGLPPAELFAGLFLLYPVTLEIGLYLSASFFFIFSCYIGLVLVHFFSKIPCSCGGLIERMGWTFHFYFNITFLALSLTSIYLTKRKEHGDKQ
jgi:hypothetical protein